MTELEEALDDLRRQSLDPADRLLDHGPAMVIQSKRVQIGVLHREFRIRAESFDEENRTVEVVWTTGARVLRTPFFSEPFEEELSLEEGHVRLERMDSGRAPFLRMHNRFSLDANLGVVMAGTTRIANGEGTCLLRFSGRDDIADIRRDVADGILTNVSVGYRVFKFEDVTPKDATVRRRRAVDWEPFEVSLVTVGADVGAGTRSADDASAERYSCELVTTTRTMEPEDEPTTNTGGEATRGASSDGGQNSPNTTNAEGAAASRNDGGESASGGNSARAETSVVTRAPSQEELDGAAARALDAERLRGAGIRRNVERVGLTLDFATRLIDERVDGRVLNGEEVSERIFAELSRQADQAPTFSHGRATVTRDEGDKRFAAMGQAIEHRMTGRVTETRDGEEVEVPLGDDARAFRSFQVPRMIEESVRIMGHDPFQMTEVERQRVALRTLPGLQGQSNFPGILENAMNKSLRGGYEAAPRTFLPISRRQDARDFKELSSLNLGEWPALQKVSANGEFKRGSVGEAKETAVLATYGIVVGFTRQAMVSDDLEAFGRLLRTQGQASAELENDVMWALWTTGGNGVVMGDGNALFSAAHNNLGAGVLSVPNLGAGRSIMRQQKGVRTDFRINVRPSWLVVPTALETTADQLVLQTIQPDSPTNANPFARSQSGGLQGVIAEPRLDDESPVEWYLAAAIAAVEMMRYGYLESAPGPVLAMREGFDIDGMEWKLTHDFYGMVEDFRGLYRSSGV